MSSRSPRAGRGPDRKPSERMESDFHLSSSNFAFGSVGLCADLARIDGGEVPVAVDLRRPNDMSSSEIVVDALLAMAVGDCIAPVEKRRNAPLAALISTKSFFFGSSGLGAATGSSGVFACTYWLNCIDACIS